MGSRKLAPNSEVLPDASVAVPLNQVAAGSSTALSGSVNEPEKLPLVEPVATWPSQVWPSPKPAAATELM